ncbi:inc metabolism membrane protein, partial [Elasticomyces elasticus]
MACTATYVTTLAPTREHHEEPTLGASSGTRFDRKEVQKRRRHSSYQPRAWATETENIQLLVDRFLDGLGRRLDFLESYGHLHLDAGIDRAYSTLHAVRDSCGHVSDEVMDAGWRRARVLVDTLQDRYRGALARKATLSQNTQEAVRFMEDILTEFEARAYAMRDAGIGVVASDFIDEGWRRMDEGLGKAKEVVDEGLEKARRATDVLKDKVDRAVSRAKEQGLIIYEDLPDPWRVNPHILRGYRFHETKVACLRSCFSLSNELVNIWSHAIGLLIVLAIAFYFYPTSANFSLSTKSDVFVAAVFFFAACKCL